MSRLLPTSSICLIMMQAGYALAEEIAAPNAVCLVEQQTPNTAKSRDVASLDTTQCTFKVHFMFKNNVDDRVFSCQILKGESSCSTNMGMTKDGKAGVPVTVEGSPNLTRDMAAKGCMYKSGYPVANVSQDLPSQMITVRYVYSCAGN